MKYVMLKSQKLYKKKKHAGDLGIKQAQFIESNKIL